MCCVGLRPPGSARLPRRLGGSEHRSFENAMQLGSALLGKRVREAAGLGSLPGRLGRSCSWRPWLGANGDVKTSTQRTFVDRGHFVDGGVAICEVS